ncbi:MAG TPA: FG-GAP-like repeat-containing protein, partial [Pirellulaceae bacterium]|nr:FG-GAP-like repeat-containing protein [Pirellulaceae bacterium]
MSFCSRFDCLNATAKQPSIRRAKRPLDRRREFRRLLLEGLEDRSLLAFNPFAQYDLSDRPQDLTLADVNADGRPDMIVASWSGNSIDVRLGNADGTFGGTLSFPTGTGPNSVAVGDLTGDGIPDLATANSGDISLLKGNGDGTFLPPQSIGLPGQFPPGYTGSESRPQLPLSVATGDVNGDGKLDLVVGADTYFTQQSCYTGYWGGYYCYDFNTYDGYVNVLLGNGTGLDPAETHHLGAWRFPNAVAVADINGDAKDDVITANDYDLSVLLNEADAPNELALGAPVHSGSGYGFRSISLGDVDGDGKLDTLSSSGWGLIVQKGNGDGTFTPQPAVNTGSYVHSAVMGDVNDDGTLDLVAVGSIDAYTCTSYGWWYGYYGGYYYCNGGYNTTTRQATVLLGNGQGNFALPLTSSFGSYVGYSWLPDVALADLNGDGLPELVTIDYHAVEAIVATNDGNWNPPPSIVISDTTVTEGDSGTVNAVFTVTVIGNHAGVSVNYSTADSTAAAGADYTATSGTLTFGVGESSKTISVPVLGDTLDEYDERFFVNLSNAVGGQITDSQGIGTIVDDDDPPLVTINDVSQKEGNKGTTSFVFTVSLSEASGKWVSVNFAT